MGKKKKIGFHKEDQNRRVLTPPVSKMEDKTWCESWMHSKLEFPVVVTTQRPSHVIYSVKRK